MEITFLSDLGRGYLTFWSVAFTKRGILLLLSIFLSVPAARGDDWPQWMGPARDGVWRETGLVKSIPPAGLPVKWRAEVKGGYSGPAVADGRVYLMDYERREGEVANAPNDRTTLAGQERVLCLDAASGRLLWKHNYDCPYAISYASGPRCTPTVADGKVYTLGAEGNLFCLDAATGRVIWSKDFKKDYSAPTPLWGFCGHPLVDGNRLVCLVGGEGSVAVAFDKDTGRELWRALSASESGYCPPSIIESAGVRQLMIWDADKLNSLDPATGTVLWSQPLKPAYGMSIMAPQVAATPRGQVLFASGIGRVGALYTLAADKPGARPSRPARHGVSRPTGRRRRGRSHLALQRDGRSHPGQAHAGGLRGVGPHAPRGPHQRVLRSGGGLEPSGVCRPLHFRAKRPGVGLRIAGGVRPENTAFLTGKALCSFILWLAGGFHGLSGSGVVLRGPGG